MTRQGHGSTVLEGRLPANAGEQRPRRLVALIWAGIAATCIGLLGFAGWTTWESRERALDVARARTADMARLLERRVAASVETAELIMHGVGRELADDPRDPSAQARAANFLAGVTARRVQNGSLAAIRGVHVVDPETGTVLFSSDRAFGRADESADVMAVLNAEAVGEHRGAESSALHVGAPVLERARDGETDMDRWSVGLSRRALGRGVRSGPIVVVHLSLAGLQRLYDVAGDLGRFGSMHLVRIDGRLLVRRPYLRESVGRDMSGSPLFTEHLGRSLSGTYANRGVLDGVDRIVSYRRLPGTPVVLAVALAEEEVLSEWSRTAVRNGGLALAAALGIAILGAWAVREAAGRARTESELAAGARVLRLTLENMDQGLLMVDAADVVQVCNRRAAELLDLAPDTMARRPSFSEVVRGQIASGEFDEDEADQLRGILAKGEGVLSTRQVYERRRPNGVVLEVRTAALEEGGAVRTYTDVTARRAIESELRGQNRRFDAALETMSQGLLMLDRNRRITVANRRLLELYGLSPDVVLPGVHARALIAHSVQLGHHAPGVTADIAWAAWVDRLGQRRDAVTFDQRLPDGRRIAVACTPAEDGGWVITHEDVTERVRAHETLANQNLLFDAALANMAHGLCMFDARSRLVVRNDRYLEIFGLSADEVPIGIEHRELVDRLVETGRYKAGATGHVLREGTRKRLATGDVSPLYRELSDGRTVAVSHRAMAGGGWVATFDDVTERRQAEAKVAHMARHDALTGLPNRLDLRERMEAALETRGEGETLAVLCLDLDRFKTVNDSLGHPVGDLLLQAVADRIRTAVGETGLVARLGGDEFAILQDRGGAEGAAELAARLVRVLGSPFDVDGHQIVVGASIGFAVAPEDGRTPDSLLRHSDMALYRAKADGRGLFRAFEPAMTEWAQSRRELELELRGALARAEFRLDYQPLVRLASDDGGCDRLIGFEALLRWNHPERGAISPAAFIPVAEEIGLIVPIGEWVLRRACHDAALHWPDAVGVAVNLSAVQFRRGEDLARIVFAALAASGLRPGRLELEITESVLLEDTEATLATLHQLRSFGVRIALDDFGTGFSSLSYLRKFPFDTIKIDRSFLRGMDSGDGAIVRAIATLGASLGMTTTAEGVETEAQLAAVRAEGCTQAQGFLFSPPRSIEALAPVMRELGARSRQAA